MRTLLLLSVLASPALLMAQAPTTPPAGQAAVQPGRPRTPGITLTTTGFEDGGVIPVKFSMAAGEAAVSPKLSWTEPPAGTASFALILHDPDTTMQHKTDQYLHWLIFNIPGTAHELPEGVPTQPELPDGSIQGVNSSRKVGYVGMGAGPNGPLHHYTFELYALDAKLDLKPDATQADVMKAMDGHVLGKASLIGRYKRAQ